MLLEIRDIAKKLLDEAGAVQMQKLFVAGDSWDSMACVDYLVERGELREIYRKHGRSRTASRLRKGSEME